MEYGRYRIVKELGSGNMGVVYQAHDPQIDRMVALKVLRSDRVTSQDFVARFLKEARAIGRLSHPQIVTVYDVGEDHQTIYIAMEYLQGQPLNEVMQKSQLSRDQVIDIVSQIASALDYAHGEGIVHRDIKPSNIIIAPGNTVKLTDFGIARIEDSAAGYQTQAGEILGTPIYMSPEQVTGKRADGRSDIYALGVLFYEMLVGKRPFGGTNIAAIFHAITHDIPEAPAEASPTISRALSAHIMTCLEKAPDKRFQTAGDLVNALNALQRDEGGPPAAHTRRQKRSATPLVAGLVVVAGLAIGGYFYFGTGPGENVNPSQNSATGPTEDSNVQQNVKQAAVNISSDPEGAAIYVDSLYMGKAPTIITLPFGKHEVRLSLPDHLAWEAQVTIDSMEEMPLHVTMRQAE